MTLDGLESEPPPAVTAHVTVTPATGLLNWSCTVTAYGCGNGDPAQPDWPSPVLFLSCVAGPAVAVTVNVAGLPPTPSADARARCWPATWPSVKVAPAIPAALVTLDEVMLPPPLTTDQVTVTPSSGVPDTSVTFAERSAPVVTGADWPSPPATTITRVGAGPALSLPHPAPSATSAVPSTVRYRF